MSHDHIVRANVLNVDRTCRSMSRTQAPVRVGNHRVSYRQDKSKPVGFDLIFEEGFVSVLPDPGFCPQVSEKQLPVFIPAGLL